MKGSQHTQGLQIEKGNKMFSDIFTIKMTRIFKAINQIRLILFITIQNRKYIWGMD